MHPTFNTSELTEKLGHCRCQSVNFNVFGVSENTVSLLESAPDVI